MAEVMLTAESLARVGVKLLNKFRVRLRCEKCGRSWMPVPCPEIRLPHNWWVCPYGCNRHLANAAAAHDRRSDGAEPTPNVT